MLPSFLKDRQKALSKKIAAEQAGAVSIKGKLDGITIEMIKKEEFLIGLEPRPLIE